MFDLDEVGVRMSVSVSVSVRMGVRVRVGCVPDACAQGGEDECVRVSDACACIAAIVRRSEEKILRSNDSISSRQNQR